MLEGAGSDISEENSYHVLLEGIFAVAGEA